MRLRGQDWLDKVYRRSNSSNRRHSAEMALKVFDRVFGELVEVLIDRVKNGEAPDKDKWKEEVELEAIRALARASIIIRYRQLPCLAE